ncbi:MAG TPA: DUF58 domain-containing protein [SAR202 cluster bacterium]|nr:DUF58 domain-containing protein [SAR202 cluster bacterium]
MVLLIITVITALATGFELFFRLAYIIIIVSLVSLISVYLNIRKIEVSIDRRNHLLSVGEQIDKRISIRNLSVIPKTLILATDITTIPEYTSSFALGLTAKGYRSWRSTDYARQRGVFEMGPIEISTTDLLGIYKASTRHGEIDKIMVYPKIYDLRNFNIGTSQITNEGTSRKKSNILSPHASSVREYAYGDSLSRVHWKTTARANRLMSKEFDVGSSNEVVILNDLDKSVQCGRLDDSTDELSISVTASLTKSYTDSHTPVGFLSHGNDRYYITPGIGSSHFDRTMQTLAVAKPGNGKKLQQVIAEERNIWFNNSSIIIITPSSETEWVTALSELSQFNTSITVIMVNAKSFGGKHELGPILSALDNIGISPYVINKNDELNESLSRSFFKRSVQNLSMTKSS